MVRTKHGHVKHQSAAGAPSTSDVDDYEWRQSDAPPAKPLQHGISPSQFYREGKENSTDNYNCTAGRRRQRDQLKKVLNEAKDNDIRERRREVTTRQKLQRAAFKEVTCLRTWPLQDMAMMDLDQLMGEHIDGKPPPLLKPQPEKEHGDSTGLSSSSMDEPKRIKPQDETLSPRKSTMRNQFKQEFLKEREIPAAHPIQKKVGVVESQEEKDSVDKGDTEENNDYGNNGTIVTATDKTFLPALWCMEPRIFSVEKSSAGKRKYLVGHLGRFLDLYWRKCDPKNRHYYELIREKTPCRLYFDLEFSKVANPDIDTEKSEDLLKEFFTELAAELKRVHDITIDRSCVVDLDSSTDKKFSRHWIVHLSNQALFPNAGAAGRFVKSFVGRLAEEAATGMLSKKCPTLSKHLFVKTQKSGGTPSQVTPCSSPSDCIPSSERQVVSPTSDDDGTKDDMPPSPVPSCTTPQASCTPCSQDGTPTTCFVDLGVYTRNRLFRLLGSSKFGKPASAALRIASSNEFPFPKGFANDSFYVPDIEKKLKGASDNAETGNEKHELETDMARFLSAVDWTVHAQALAETLVVPINGSKLNFLILRDVDAGANDTLDDISKSQGGKPLSREIANRKVSLSSASGAESSPFPILDDFVLNVLGTRGGVQGSIRIWSIDYGSHADTNTATESPHVPRNITYQMCRNRWCERIGRAHKSNNIMWTIDLQSMKCVQSCHDPECRTMRYRGTPVALPEPVRQQVQEVLFEQQLALMDEQEFLHKQTTASRQEELDDAEFERALLNLDISGKKDKDKGLISHQTKKSQSEKSGQNSAASASQPEELLSDSTLFDAVLSNPELFP